MHKKNVIPLQMAVRNYTFFIKLHIYVKQELCSCNEWGLFVSISTLSVFPETVNINCHYTCMAQQTEHKDTYCSTLS